MTSNHNSSLSFLILVYYLQLWRKPVEATTPEYTSNSESTTSVNTDSDGPTNREMLHEPFSQVSKVTCDMFHGFDVPPHQWADINGHEKKKIRVLSLFYGISTGYYILQEKLNLNIEVYYSSEIDPAALQVQRENFDGRVTPIGSVTDLTDDRLKGLGRIDLLIGGSPCSDLSLVNPKRRGLLGKLLFFTSCDASTFII